MNHPYITGGFLFNVKEIVPFRAFKRKVAEWFMPDYCLRVLPAYSEGVMPTLERNAFVKWEEEAKPQL